MPDANCRPRSRSASARNHGADPRLPTPAESGPVPIGPEAAAESPDSSDEDLQAFVQKTIAEWELTGQHLLVPRQHPDLQLGSRLRIVERPLDSGIAAV